MLSCKHGISTNQESSDMKLKYLIVAVLMTFSFAAQAAPKSVMINGPVWDDGSGCGCTKPCPYPKWRR